MPTALGAVGGALRGGPLSGQGPGNNAGTGGGAPAPPPVFGFGAPGADGLTPREAFWRLLKGAEVTSGGGNKGQGGTNTSAGPAQAQHGLSPGRVTDSPRAARPLAAPLPAKNGRCPCPDRPVGRPGGPPWGPPRPLPEGPFRRPPASADGLGGGVRDALDQVPAHGFQRVPQPVEAAGR